MRHGGVMPRNELIAFRQWVDQAYYILPSCGDYDVLRWQGTKENKPMPIVFRRDKTPDVLTVNGEAWPYYLDWKDGFE